MKYKSLFKYSEKKYADGLLSWGSVRVGTLYNFREIEHKKGIADPNEGKKVISHYIEHWRENDEVTDQYNMHERSLSQVGGFILEPGGGQQFHGVTVARQIEDPDHFIHCTSLNLSEEVMSEFEGANSCVEIFNFRGFYKELTRSINKQVPVKFLGLAPVVYRARHEIWNGINQGIPACVIKETHFKMQYEVRAVWAPVNKEPITPLTFNNIALARFCKRTRLK